MQKTWSIDIDKHLVGNGKGAIEKTRNKRNCAKDEDNGREMHNPCLSAICIQRKLRFFFPTSPIIPIALVWYIIIIITAVICDRTCLPSVVFPISPINELGGENRVNQGKRGKRAANVFPSSLPFFIFYLIKNLPDSYDNYTRMEIQI
jgi:hypothetical protein